MVLNLFEIALAILQQCRNHNRCGFGSHGAATESNNLPARFTCLSQLEIGPPTFGPYESNHGLTITGCFVQRNSVAFREHYSEVVMARLNHIGKGCRRLDLHHDGAAALFRSLKRDALPATRFAFRVRFAVNLYVSASRNHRNNSRDPEFSRFLNHEIKFLASQQSDRQSQIQGRLRTRRLNLLDYGHFGGITRERLDAAMKLSSRPIK